MKFLRKNIRKIRMTKRLNQEDFAVRFGITRSTLGAYEEGRAEPKLSFVYRIAKEYNINLMAMMDRDLTVNDISGFAPDKSSASAFDVQAEFRKLAARVDELEKRLND